MKKVINNKVYDTDTAGELGRDDHQHPGSIDWWRETLYRKRTGEHFLHGEGGAGSRYGVWEGNTGRPGEKIMPLVYEEARKWAEEHLDGDGYLAVFGDPEGGTEVIRVEVGAAVKARLDREASKTGKTRTQIIEELLRGLPG